MRYHPCMLNISVSCIRMQRNMPELSHMQTPSETQKKQLSCTETAWQKWLRGFELSAEICLVIVTGLTGLVGIWMWRPMSLHLKIDVVSTSVDCQSI